MNPALFMTVVALASAICQVTLAAPPPKTLTIVVQGAGTVALDPPGGAYPRNTTVVMTATPAEGWAFDHWDGPTIDGSTANPQPITMWNNYTVTAVFVQDGGIDVVRKRDAIIRVVDANAQPVAGADVQIDMTAIDFAFGTAINPSALDYPAYANWVRDNYNWVVAENASKWTDNEPIQGVVSFTNADKIHAFAAANGIEMRGHTVFWAVPDFVQQWVKDLPYPGELQAAVDARLNDAVNHFKGRFRHWDVNNEMLHGSFFADRLGSDIRPYMFNRVKQIDPDVLTFINDYNIISGGYDLADYVAQIEDLRAAGAQIDAVGVQGHFSDGETIAAVAQRLDSIAAVGLPIWITEYDFAHPDPLARADFLEDFYRLAFGHPAVEGILMWGFWANAHWRGADAALLDADFTVNAAGQRYQALRTEWWTNANGTTDAAGEAGFNGFHGQYVVTVSDGINPPETHPISLSGGNGTRVYTLQIGTGTPADLTPPAPNPPTWQSLPAAIGDDAIAMQANAADPSGVEYYFANQSMSGHDSGWQDSAFYVDTGLDAATNYNYTVTARDKSISANTTAASAGVWAQTQADDGNILVNEGFEWGRAEAWNATATAAVEVQSAVVHSGSYAARASGRSAAWDGMGQNLEHAAINGATWQCSAWMRLENAASAPVGMTMQVTDRTGTDYHGMSWDTATDTGWVELSGPVTLNYTGELAILRLYFEGPDPSVNYYLDDVSCTGDSGEPVGVSVQDIAMAYSKRGPNYTASATVTVVDSNGAAAPGANVSGTWSGAVTGDASGTTGNDGRVTLASPKSRSTGIYVFTVDDVTGNGYRYDPAANVETSDQLTVP